MPPQQGRISNLGPAVSSVLQVSINHTINMLATGSQCAYEVPTFFLYDPRMTLMFFKSSFRGYLFDRQNSVTPLPRDFSACSRSASPETLNYRLGEIKGRGSGGCHNCEKLGPIRETAIGMERSLLWSLTWDYIVSRNSESIHLFVF